MGEWEDRGEGGRNGKCRERMGGMGRQGSGWGMGSVGKGWEEWEDRGEGGRNGKCRERMGGMGRQGADDRNAMGSVGRG